MICNFRTPVPVAAARIFWVFVSITLFFAAPARADGGAHVVDSANVETPGVCHLESWVTRFGPERGLFNLAPACTRQEMPNLEIGASLQHAWDRSDVTQAGPALKWNLRQTETGLGIGVLANAGLNLRTGQTESAALIVPVSIPLGDRLLLNFNGGWTYAAARTERNQIFCGAQLQAVVAHDLSVMAEVFGNLRERPGFQAGLRWNPGGGEIDLDFLAGRRVDGSDAHAITLGMTVRR